MKKGLGVAILLISTCFVYAGGFRISLQGVRQAAMAHTSAHVKDASVMFYNPAGISFIPEKISASAGIFGVSTKSMYQNSKTLYSAETDNKLGTPFYAAFSYGLKDNVCLGLSVTTPFGNSIDWGKDWEGQDLVQDIQLKSFFIQPTVAYKFNKWISAGVGYIYATGSINLNRSISNISFSDGSPATLELNSNANGHGFNAGVYIRPTDKLDVSIAYRSKVKMKVKDGDANFNLPNGVVDSSGSGTFQTKNDSFDATLPLSSELTLGVSYRVSPKWLLSSDINYAGWESYKSLDINFGHAKIGNDSNDNTLSKTKKDFKNSFIYRIGTEYLITDKLAGRLGYYYDTSPVKDEHWSPETPSTNNHTFTAGLGYQLKKEFSIDLTGGFITGEERNITNDNAGFYGQVKSRGVFIGLGVSYNK
ncbi:MAG: outer membrane protein transport protein [Flavobacteriales bacterium]|nr:outer membrane protein transport protein [Flavobacteriales bacterium]